MTLPVAPCPRCQSPVVYGERQCRVCAQPFDYGAAAVPIPSVTDIQTALAALQGFQATPVTVPQVAPDPFADEPVPTIPPRAAAANPISIPGGDPVDDGTGALVERTSFAAVGAVVVEDIPGFIDSSLFASMTPKEVAVERVPGLEPSHAEDPGDVAVVSDPALLLETGRFDAESTTPVAPEEIPGFIDSSLFAAFTPATVETESIAGLEVAWRTKAAEKPQDKDELPPCRDCGTKFLGTACPACGARRASE